MQTTELTLNAVYINNKNILLLTLLALSIECSNLFHRTLYF